jgi:sigma-B regulation protein RsbU (phosphoserine phosphatase)
LLQARGRFLGSLDGLTLDEASLRFSSGDVLVCYSDGLTDSMSPTGDYYGLERIKAAVAAANTESAGGLTRAIIADVDAFRDGLPQPDDLPLLVMRVQ